MSPIDFAFIFSSYQDTVDLDVSVWAFLFFFFNPGKTLKIIFRSQGTLEKQ